MKKIIQISISLLFVLVHSQKTDKSLQEDRILVENDTIEFSLNEIKLLKKLKLDNKKERRYYYWYRKKIRKAYPYALLTANSLEEVDVQLLKIKNKRKKKKYIKKAQKLLNEEFKEQLKKLTRTEGKLLIRLIHRQTGTTVFELVKKYRSGWKAFWYNSSANLFKLSLKKEYHPEKEDLDFLVEDILQRDFLDGFLIEKESKLDFDYYNLTRKYSTMNIVKWIDER